MAMIPTEHIYGELQRAFAHFNQTLFDGQLPPCLFTLQREKRTYGYFSAKRFIHRSGVELTDEIAINPAYFAVVPLGEVLQTIVHEMAHLWQFHFGDPGRRAYHNQEWADKMETIGLMPSNTGKPGGKKTGERMGDYPIEGGRFLIASTDLVKQGFGLDWLDRFPPLEATAPGLRAMVAPQGALGQALAQAAGEAAAAPAANKSLRVKQRCPSCQAQAWGKPDLRLLCGNPGCKKIAFEEAA